MKTTQIELTHAELCFLASLNVFTLKAMNAFIEEKSREGHKEQIDTLKINHRHMGGENFGIYKKLSAKCLELGYKNLEYQDNKKLIINSCLEASLDNGEVKIGCQIFTREELEQLYKIYFVEGHLDSIERNGEKITKNEAKKIIDWLKISD